MKHEIIRRLFARDRERKSISPSIAFALDQTTAEHALLDFESHGGHQYLAKFFPKRIITWGSEAHVYRWIWNGEEFAIKKPKTTDIAKTYFSAQIAGQILLEMARVRGFAPIQHVKGQIDYVVQRFITGNPGVRRKTVIRLLAQYGLTMAEPNPNAIETPLGIVIYDFSYIHRL